MKKVISILLILQLFLASASLDVSSTEDDYLVSIDFAKEYNAKNATVRSGDRGIVSVFQKDGTDCWQTNIEGSVLYIYINIDDDVLYDEHVALEVEIEYYDSDNAQFSLNYESQTATYAQTQGIFTTGTKTWKTASFYIDDTKLANGQNGADMRLTPYVDKKGRSASDISFKSVRIKKVKFRNPVKLSYSFDTPGGIYFEDTANATLHFANVIDQEFNILGKASIYWNDNFIYEESFSFFIDKKGSYVLDKIFKMSEYGLYKAEITLIDSDGYFEWVYDVLFSKSVLNTVKNMRNGTNGHYGQGKGYADINAKLMAQSGYGWARDSQNWDQIEKEPGVYVWRDSIIKGIDAFYENGLEVLYILGYTNPLYDDGSTPASEEAIAAYARYCYETAKFFQGKISHYEIWNEYNIRGFNPSSEPPETYARMLKAGYEAIKKADPNAVVIGCATCKIDLGWIERVFAAGGYDYMDVVSVHPYKVQAPDSDDMRSDVRKLKELCLKYGEEKPIYYSEEGFSTAPNQLEEHGYTERQATINLAKHVFANNAFDLGDVVFMYDFQNDGPDPNEKEQNFGIIRTWEHPTGAWDYPHPNAAKESFVAISFSNYIDTSHSIKEIIADTPDERILLYESNDSDDDMVIMWSEGDKKRISLKLSPEITVFDLYGNPTKMQSENSVFTFELGGSIVYIKGEFETPVITDNDYFISEKRMSIAKGEHFVAGINRLNADSDVTFRIVDGKEFTEQQEVTIEAGAYKANVEMKAPSDLEIGIYEIFFVDDTGQVLGLEMEIDIMEPVVISKPNTAMMYSNNYDYWYAEFNITNNSNGMLNGEVYFSDYDYAPNIPRKFYNLKPCETRSVRIAFRPMKEKKLASTEICIELDSGVRLTEIYMLSFLAARKANETKPVIDGVISPGEWRSGTVIFIDDPAQVVNIIGYGGIRDLSAKAYIMWDEEYLYVAADVTDNVFHQEYTGVDIWRGDSLQIALFATELAADYRGQQFEIGVAYVNNKTQVYRYSGIDNKTGTLDTVEAVVKRMGTKTVYEMKIPWTEIFDGLVEVKENKTMKFSILINDNDGTGRRGWMEYGGGIGSGKNPNLYLDLYLGQ